MRSSKPALGTLVGRHVLRGHRILAVAVFAAAASLAVAAPASAEIIRFEWTDPQTTETLQPCGAVNSFIGEHSVQLVQNGKDEFVRWIQQDVYTGTITYQGETYRANDRQVHIRYVSRDDVPIGVLNGQGLFTHLPGVGVAFYDVGHLVFNDDTGETLLKSDKVVGFDEEFDFGSAVCAALAGA
jgi:hypothetical protein